MRKEPVTELWAILDLEGRVMWSRGGSSSKQKLLIYPTKRMAENVLNNSWTKQSIPDSSKVKIEKIYETN